MISDTGESGHDRDTEQDRTDVRDVSYIWCPNCTSVLCVEYCVSDVPGSTSRVPINSVVLLYVYIQQSYACYSCLLP